MKQSYPYEYHQYTAPQQEVYAGYQSQDRQDQYDDGSFYQQQQPLTDGYIAPGYPLDENARLYAGLSYVGFWLSALLVLLFVRKNRLAHFHAMQSLLLFGAVTVLYFVFINIMIQHTPFLFGFAIFAFVIMNIIALVAWIVGIVQGFSGYYTKLPFVGSFAEKYAHTNSTVK